MSDSREHQEFAQELDRLAGAAGKELAAVEHARHWREAFPAALPLAVLAAATYAILQLFGRLGHVSFLQHPVGFWLLLVAAAWLFRTWHLVAAARRREQAVARARALGEWDRQLHLADRLGAADEFLQQDSRSPFMEAAIADAEAHVARTKEAALAFTPTTSPQRWLSPILAIAMCLVVGMILGDWQAQAVATEAGLTASLPQGPAAVGEQTAVDEAGSPPVPAQATAKPKPERKPSTAEASAETHAANRETGQDERSSKGDIGSGRSSAAESSSGAGNAQGTPSKQGQISKPGERKSGSTKPKPPKPRKEQTEEKPRKTDEQESGSTAGRGSSRGSNKNPAASDWASKDHVNTPDDEDLDQEEEVDDEDEEQESRGGMQPTMRDRKPPVSRDLSIGFGNQKSDDAKGRGGPSSQKKSRGTASLVLGVPIPDRIKGQPNPGKTKITQERVQPQAEPAKPGTAEARLARAEPASSLRRDPLAPWMSRVVRDYFLQLRQQDR